MYYKEHSREKLEVAEGNSVVAHIATKNAISCASDNQLVLNWIHTGSNLEMNGIDRYVNNLRPNCF